MDIIKINGIETDGLPFDFTELNKQANIDKQKENPASYAAVVEPCEVDFDQFIGEMNSLFQYVYDNSKE